MYYCIFIVLNKNWRVGDMEEKQNMDTKKKDKYRMSKDMDWVILFVNIWWLESNEEKWYTTKRTIK